MGCPRGRTGRFRFGCGKSTGAFSPKGVIVHESKVTKTGSIGPWRGVPLQEQQAWSRVLNEFPPFDAGVISRWALSTSASGPKPISLDRYVRYAYKWHVYGFTASEWHLLTLSLNYLLALDSKVFAECSLWETTPKKFGQIEMDPTDWLGWLDDVRLGGVSVLAASKVLQAHKRHSVRFVAENE